MNKLLLAKILFLLTPIPVFSQDINCPTAKDSVWINKRFPKQLERYEKKTIFIFEQVFTDTVSVLVDGKLVAKEYMESTSAGRILKDVVVSRPLLGDVVVRSARFSCTQFKLRKGYKYVYINQDAFGKWFITYSNYGRAYY
jgi:hypothetical protein